MNIYTLISEYKHHNPYGHYFDRETLKFFGERISEMRVLKETCKVKDYNGEIHEAYCVSSLQRKCPCGPQRHYTFFDVNSFDQIIT